LDVREYALGGFRSGGQAAHPDWHLCAVAWLLRRLLFEGAEAPNLDQAGLRRDVHRGRRDPDADHAVARFRDWREDWRSVGDVSQRHLHRDGEYGGVAG